MAYKVAIFEVEGGSDKWLSGRRKDTMPIVTALRERGVETDILAFRSEWVNDLNLHTFGRYDAYTSRVNPGNIPGGEAEYFGFLRGLSEAGIVACRTPTTCSPSAPRTCWRSSPAPTSSRRTRSRTTTSSRCGRPSPPPSAADRGCSSRTAGRPARGSGTSSSRTSAASPPARPPLDTKVRCTEAVDNHVEHRTLQDFMAMCVQYVIGETGMVVDMRFMPRIVEGEIRILLVGETPVFAVHKKPAEEEGAFSATLFSGATYTYDSPDDPRWAPSSTSRRARRCGRRRARRSRRRPEHGPPRRPRRLARAQCPRLDSNQRPRD